MLKGDPVPITSPTDYLERLVHAIVVTEHAHGTAMALIDAGTVEAVIRDRLYPMILEWSTLSFLPPPELLVLADRFLQRPPEGTYLRHRDILEYFSHTLRDSDGTPLVETMEGELAGLSHLQVQQAVRARALAIVCPSPRLDGCYRGKIAELRAHLKSPGDVRAAYHGQFRDPETTEELPDLFRKLDLDWMAHQVRSWNRKGIREFLSWRLRSRNVRDEEVESRVDDVARGLLGALKKVVEAKNTKLDSVEALLEVVRTRPSGEMAEAALRRVLPVVALDDPPWASQELPLGGYSDLTTKGPFDRLLISNLAYPEEEFARRLVEGELLFYELEAPPAQKPPRQYVLLDASPATWGIPRLAGGAVALSVANRARERRAEAVVLAAGRMDRPFEGLDRVLGVHEILDHQRWESGLRDDLRAFASRVRSETKDHPTGADLFVCTESGRLEEIREWATASGLPSAARLHVFSCDLEDGRAALWRWHGGGFVPVSSLSLAAKDLVPPREEAAPAAPASSLSASRVEMNWDWSSNVTCAAMDARGLAVTGHANGEVHLWDAVRAQHLGQRCTFPHAVTAVALSGETVAVAIANLMQSEPFAARMFAFPRLGGRISPIRSQPAREHPEALRAGWEPGQFFWFETEETLVEYRADLVQTRRHSLPSRKEARRPFFVDGGGRWVVWKNVEGAMVSFNLKGFNTGPTRFSRVAEQEARHRAVDPSGRLLVQMSAGGTASEVRWIETPSDAERGVTTIPGSQHPKAVSVAADRLLAENSNSIWFWSLKQGKLRKEIIAPSQEITALRAGSVAGAGDQVNAVLVEVKGVAGLVLHWGAAGVQVDPIVDAGKVYRSQADGTRGAFHEKLSKEATTYPDARASLIVGGLVVACRSDRLIEFYLEGRDEPLLRFWFKVHACQWALVSREYMAGNALGELAFPGGASLLHRGEQLAGMLAAGVRRG